MNILVITWNFPPRRGGIENLMAQLSVKLQRKHTVRIITAYAKGGNADVFRAPLPGLIPFACYALWRAVWLLLVNRNIDVIFGGSAMVAPLVYFLGRVFRRKAIVQVHGLDLVYGSVVYQALCVRWLKYCNRVIANSRYTETLARERGVPRGTTCVIPLGVDAARFAPAPNIAQLKREFRIPDKQVILFVGRLAPRKGVREFVSHCLPIIVQELPRVCFVVAGGNPTESLTQREDVLKGIKTAVRQSGLQDHVRLCGEVSDEELVKLYQCSDIVVLPALSSREDAEGFGMVLLEAAAAGKPVVATEVGGIPDAVEDGKTGILVNAGNYRELAKSLLELLANGEKRRIMGECARGRTEREYSWETVVARYEGVFSRDKDAASAEASA
jgi:phosphatidylinositol alpha-1,6-mannosyltransferase